MSTIATMELSDGSTILIEVQTTSNYHQQAGVDSAKLVQRALASCGAAVRSFGNELMSSIALSVEGYGRPAEVEVALSIKAAGEADWVIASGSAEANINIKLVWKDRDESRRFPQREG